MNMPRKPWWLRATTIVVLSFVFGASTTLAQPAAWEVVGPSPPANQMTQMKRVLAVACVTLLGAAPVAYAQSKSVSKIATGKASAVDATDSACTAANFFHDMPDMSKSFSFGGTASRHVIVLFQGEFRFLTEGTSVLIQLLIDGVVQSGPRHVVIVSRQLGDEHNPPGTHGFNFISDRLAPGTHTAQIQWRDSGAGPGCVETRSLVVLHK
jgi:hypothetical protein